MINSQDPSIPITNTSVRWLLGKSNANALAVTVALIGHDDF
jgi:hypothetical protein